MPKITILGAGDMGTALVTPLVRNGHDVVLWGTERDEAIVAALRAGEEHPRLRVTTPANVAIAGPDEVQALGGADLIVVAVTSDAVRDVLSHLGGSLGSPRAVVTVAKGFDAGPDGVSPQLLPETIAEYLDAPIVAVGGPSKANEVAHGLPTSVIFGSEHKSALALACTCFATPAYIVHPTDDVKGLEAAAAMKNAYAIALGIPDGLEQRTGRPHHNLRAALFPIAVSELGAIARLLGGRETTAHGLAGAGDLLVTITSGRNRLLGERIGLGETPDVAVRTLTGQGTTIEGYPAARFGHGIYRDAIRAGRMGDGKLPLLDAIWRILYLNDEPETALLNVL